MTQSPSPAERVRARLRRAAGPGVAAALPRGYQRLGRVLVLRLPESLRPYFSLVGEAWQTELGVETVLQHAGRTEGEDRRPRVEVIAGTETETTVRENGVVYRFDAARQMFAAGNRTERRRAGEVTRPEDTVVDLFAGIGYFALPAARYGRARRVLAVERNEEAFGFLMENVRRNGVVGRVEAILGDNRSATLPHVEADRVFMGYLPSAVPWIPRALELTRPGATLHVHLVGPTHAGPDGASDTVRTAVHRAGASVRGATAREVKPYGPGTAHYVVDVSVGEAD